MFWIENFKCADELELDAATLESGEGAPWLPLSLEHEISDILFQIELEH
jgi:hypothetical protein